MFCTLIFDIDVNGGDNDMKNIPYSRMGERCNRMGENDIKRENDIARFD